MARRKKKQTAQDDVLVDVGEVTGQAQSFIEENQNYIFGGLLAVVLLIGGFFYYSNFIKAPNEKEAADQLYQAQLQFERDSFAVALANPGGGNLGFTAIISDFSGTKAANVATYYAGVSYLYLGQYDEAISHLKDFSPVGTLTPITKFSALGDAYSEKNDFDSAISNYKKAINASDNELLSPYLLKKIGLLYQKQGNKDGALESFKEIKEKYPTSSEGKDIEKYIARLGQ